MLSGLIIALAIVLFAGIVGWAYSPQSRAGFDAAARAPLEGDRQ